VDKIVLQGISVETTLGVYAWEKVIKQTLLVDVTLYKSLQAAAQTDDLSQSVDYADVTLRIRACGAEKVRLLVEALAEDIAELLLKMYALSRVEVVVHKPGALLKVKDVSIHLVREAG
jgi:dihydroneopterin aldolase